jgi:uncharacterized membrane protein YdbT with pleckstrin-like domain
VSSGAWGSPPDPPEPPPAPPSAQWAQPAAPVQRATTSGLAVAALVTGLFFWCFLVPGIVGIVLGFIALEQIADAQGRVKGRGMAIAGIVLGYVGIGIVGALVLAWVISILV